MGLVKFTGRLLFAAYFAYLGNEMLQNHKVNQSFMVKNYHNFTVDLNKAVNFDLAKYVPALMVAQNKYLICQILSYGLVAASVGTALYVDGVPML